MKRRYVLAVALTLALVLAARLFWAFWPFQPKEGTPPPSPAVSPQAQSRTLALLGSSADPKCQPVYDALEEWARANGWAFVSYDCHGWAVGQKGQVEDLLAHEGHDVAVLYAVGSQEELDGWAKALHDGGCRVITLGQSVSRDSEGYVDCHIGPDAQALVSAAAKLVPGQTALLQVDLPEDPMAEATLAAMGKAGLEVAEYGACWGQSQYAREYLEGALERHPGVDAILCLSREGARGAREALEARGQSGSVSVLCLDCTPGILEDLVLGEVDAAVGVSLGETAGQLTQAIPRVAQGTHLGRVALDVVTATAENAQSIDLGYGD